ncbi:ABC transporter permease [Bacillus massiliigorillae]|uniref:ABC transporter permease n=1 Tax=Bacillus massiliigorillae TaxID=1243664 RepID=UPI0003A163CC|nr:ABC transporter permease [Bacillus massiliigorillae]
MLNHIKADLYRIIFRKSFILLAIILTGSTVLAFIGFSSDPEKTLSFYTTISFLLYLFLSVLISDYTLREELELKVLKNDMTTGVSRNVLYISKYLSGVILTIALWLLISLAITVTAVFITSPAGAIDYMKELFSLPQLLIILQVLFCLGLFQLIGLFVRKTILLLLLCVALEKVFMVIVERVPLFQDLANKYSSNSFAAFLLTIFAIVAIVIIGSIVFKKKEL